MCNNDKHHQCKNHNNGHGHGNSHKKQQHSGAPSSKGNDASEAASSAAAGISPETAEVLHNAVTGLDVVEVALQAAKTNPAGAVFSLAVGWLVHKAIDAAKEESPAKAGEAKGENPEGEPKKTKGHKKSKKHHTQDDAPTASPDDELSFLSYYSSSSPNNQPSQPATSEHSHKSGKAWPAAEVKKIHNAIMYSEQHGLWGLSLEARQTIWKCVQDNMRKHEPFDGNVKEISQCRQS